MNNDKKIVVVLSGGLDSTILLYSLVNELGKDNVFALTFDYNQKHKDELDCAKRSCQKLGVNHKIIDIPFLGEIIKNVSALAAESDIETPNIKDVLGDPQPVTYVPYRNLILSSLAFSFAESNGCSEVYLGIQSHDLYSYWDTSSQFVEALNRVSMLNRQHKIEIKTPFVNMSKQEEIAIGLKLGVPFEDTWTCYDPVNSNDLSSKQNIVPIACSTCPSCAERIQNFILAKVKDPIDYAKEIDWCI